MIAEIIENELDGHGRRSVRVKYTFDDGFIHVTGRRMVPEGTDVQADADARIPRLQAKRAQSIIDDRRTGFRDRASDRFAALLDRSDAGEELPLSAFAALRTRMNEYAAQ